MGGDGGLRLGEDDVGVGLIGGKEVGLISRGVDRRRRGSGLGSVTLRPAKATLRPAEATLTMSFRSELRRRR